MAGGKVQAWGARGRRGGRRALSSKSAHADALTPIFVAIAEPQLPEPMSATFSGIVAGIYVRERRLWMQGVVGGNRAVLWLGISCSLSHSSFLGLSGSSAYSTVSIGLTVGAVAICSKHAGNREILTPRTHPP